MKKFAIIVLINLIDTPRFVQRAVLNKKNKKVETKKNYRRTRSQKMADFVCKTIGSWAYVLVQTSFIVLWIFLNIIGFVRNWDPYPFIFLNLALSVIATYSAPIILMSQNREAERDRLRAVNDLATDRRAERRIIQMQKVLVRMEKKIDSLKKNETRIK